MFPHTRTFATSRAGKGEIIYLALKVIVHNCSGDVQQVNEFHHREEERLYKLPEVFTFSFFATTALASFSSCVAVVTNWCLSMRRALSKRSEHLRWANESPDTITFTSLLALVSISCPYSLYLSEIAFTVFFFFSSSSSLFVPSDQPSSSSRMTSASWKACSRSVWTVTC